MRLLQHWSLILILIGYSIGSLIFTYPLIFSITNHLPGYPMDAFTYLWNIDTFWHGVSQLHNPFFTTRTFYPIGMSLAFHTYAPLVSIPGIFLLKNLVLYMNILIFVGLIASAFLMFLLVSFLTKNEPIAFISGLLYGFSPIMTSFILSQHYYYVLAAPYLPLGALLLFQFAEKGQKRFLLGIAAIFWLSFFTDYYTTFLLVIILLVGGVILSWKLWQEGEFHRIFNKTQFPSYLNIFLLCFVLPMIFFFTVVFKFSDFGGWARTRSEYFYSYCNTNLAGFIIPSELNPILKPAAQALYTKVGLEKNYDTPSYFLGWSLLSLAAISFLTFRKNKYILALGTGGVVILLLSLGTAIRFGQTELLSGPLTPFYWLSQFPFLGLIDCPLRFPIVTQLSLAAFVGFLVAQKIATRKLPTILATTFLFLIFVIEYGSWNMELSPTSIPSIYQRLAAQYDPYTILELPSGITESKGGFGYDWSIQALHSKQLYWQTVHKKPRVGGYLSRVSSNTYKFYKNQPIISDLFQMTSLGGQWPGKEYTREEISKFLEHFNIGYIILSPNLHQNQFVDVVERLFDGFMLDKQESEGYILYRIRRL